MIVVKLLIMIKLGLQCCAQKMAKKQDFSIKIVNSEFNLDLIYVILVKETWMTVVSKIFDDL